jgi:hypothetical protein
VIRRAIAALIALFAVVAIAACGGETETNNEYVEKVNQIQADFATSAGKIGEATNPSTAASGIRSVKDGLDKAVSDLEGVDAPEDLKVDHNKLVSILKKFSSDISTALRDITGADPAKIGAAITSLGTAAAAATTQFSTTISQMNEKLKE